jgi:hypothetical protein
MPLAMFIRVIFKKKNAEIDSCVFQNRSEVKYFSRLKTISCVACANKQSAFAKNLSGFVVKLIRKDVGIVGRKTA